MILGNSTVGFFWGGGGDSLGICFKKGMLVFWRCILKCLLVKSYDVWYLMFRRGRHRCRYRELVNCWSWVMTGMVVIRLVSLLLCMYEIFLNCAINVLKLCIKMNALMWKMQWKNREEIFHAGCWRFMPENGKMSHLPFHFYICCLYIFILLLKWEIMHSKSYRSINKTSLLLLSSS